MLATASISCYASTSPIPKPACINSIAFPLEHNTIYANGKAQFETLISLNKGCSKNLNTNLQAYYYISNQSPNGQGVINLTDTSTPSGPEQTGAILGMSMKNNGFTAGAYGSTDVISDTKVSGIAYQSIYFSSLVPPGLSGTLKYTVVLCYKGTQVCQALQTALTSNHGDDFESILNQQQNNVVNFNIDTSLPKISSDSLLLARAGNSISKTSGVQQSFKILGYQFNGQERRLNPKNVSVSIATPTNRTPIYLMRNGDTNATGVLASTNLGMGKLLQGKADTPGANTVPDVPWYDASVSMGNAASIKKVKSYNDGNITLIFFTNGEVSIGNTSYMFSLPVGASVENVQEVSDSNKNIGYTVYLSNGNGLLVSGSPSTVVKTFQVPSALTNKIPSITQYNSLGVLFSSGWVSLFNSPIIPAVVPFELVQNVYAIPVEKSGQLQILITGSGIGSSRVRIPGEGYTSYLNDTQFNPTSFFNEKMAKTISRKTPLNSAGTHTNIHVFNTSDPIPAGNCKAIAAGGESCYRSYQRVYKIEWNGLGNAPTVEPSILKNKKWVGAGSRVSPDLAFPSSNIGPQFIYSKYSPFSK